MDITTLLLITTIISGILTLIGVKLIQKSYKSNRAAKKYEFENRNSGGTVEFDSFEKYETHVMKERTSGCGFSFGIIFTVIMGSIFLLCVFLTYVGLNGGFNQ